MPSPAINMAGKFIGHLRHLEKTRVKMESLFNQGQIVRRDIEQVYAGLFMEAVTSFEAFIEKLFIGLIVKSITHSSNSVHPQISTNSHRIARQIVIGGRHYVDWLPYNYTEDRANAFFRNGLPFTCLTANDKGLLGKLYTIRNSIAHKSKYSKRKFDQKVIGTLALMPREKTPAGYLRSIYRVRPNQTRYEELIIGMSNLSTKLC